jgi:uncharacterized protein (TIRG00374 family)
MRLRLKSLGRLMRAANGNNAMEKQPESHAREAPLGEDKSLKQKMWSWPTYASIAVSIVILSILVSMLDIKEIWREFEAADKFYILIAALSHYATYLVRGMRWRNCLTRFNLKDGSLRFSLLVFFYNFVDNVVPAKFGDLYASHMARINFGVRRSAAIGSIVFLRMIDAWVLLLLAGVSSWILFAAKLPNSVLWSLILGIAIAVGATSIILVFFFFKKSIPGFLPEKVVEMIKSFQDGMWPQPERLILIAGLTVVIWMLESLWIFFLCMAFGFRLSVVELVFLTMIPLLATSFPFTPSGTGVVELTLFSCLRLVGAVSPVAASITVVNRFIDFWLHIGLGLVVFAFRRMLNLRTWREVPMKTDNLSSRPPQTPNVQEGSELLTRVEP